MAMSSASLCADIQTPDITAPKLTDNDTEELDEGSLLCIRTAGALATDSVGTDCVVLTLSGKGLSILQSATMIASENFDKNSSCCSRHLIARPKLK